MSAMDLDDTMSIASGVSRIHQTAATILCCQCGTPMNGADGMTTCVDCMKMGTSISEGIPREGTLQYCRDCERWLQGYGSQTWLVASPESRELLALCLKKLRGLQKVRLVDASFIWTEPHSRRVKIKITIQNEVGNGVILQEAFEVEYVVQYSQCPDCQKSYTANVWRASVQIRQKVPHHQRTFLHLEQLILKHKAHKDTINIKEVKGGLDFFFSERNQAAQFVDFLTSTVPCKSKQSSELISMDVHTSKKSYKFTYSVELLPICKDDLVCLPIKLARQLGNIAPVTLCYRVGTSVNLLDPNTLQTADISPAIYWREPFQSLADVQELTEFIVMDIDLTGIEKGRWALAEVTVARAADLGVNNKTYFCRTHLGHILQPGDSVSGFCLDGAQFNSAQFDAVEQSNVYSSQIPEVVLVKKFYPRKKKSKNRNWRLKRMAKDEGELLPKKADQERIDRDYEAFLRDVEEDEELRATLALYKAKQKAKRETEAMSVAETSDGDEDVPQINMDELLDEFDELNVDDGDEVMA